MSTAGEYCARDGADMILLVRVVPRARKTAFAGTRAGRLLVRLQAPPVDGKANAALERFLADAFGVHRSAITIEAGTRGRDKRVRIHRPTGQPARIPVRTGGAPSSARPAGH